MKLKKGLGLKGKMKAGDMVAKMNAMKAEGKSMKKVVKTGKKIVKKGTLAKMVKAAM